MVEARRLKSVSMWVTTTLLLKAAEFISVYPKTASYFSLGFLLKFLKGIKHERKALFLA
jgi:hypothetical protein